MLAAIVDLDEWALAFTAVAGHQTSWAFWRRSLIGCPNDIHAIIFRIVRSKAHCDRAACVGRVWISIGGDVSACRTVHDLNVAFELEIFIFYRRHKIVPRCKRTLATVNAQAFGF